MLPEVATRRGGRLLPHGNWSVGVDLAEQQRKDGLAEEHDDKLAEQQKKGEHHESSTGLTGCGWSPTF